MTGDTLQADFDGESLTASLAGLKDLLVYVHFCSMVLTLRREFSQAYDSLT